MLKMRVSDIFVSDFFHIIIKLCKFAPDLYEFHNEDLIIPR